MQKRITNFNLDSNANKFQYFIKTTFPCYKHLIKIFLLIYSENSKHYSVRRKEKNYKNKKIEEKRKSYEEVSTNNVLYIFF